MATQIIGQFIEETRSDRVKLYREELSPKKLGVLRFLTKGLTNKEIAALLKIAESTVKNHLGNILARLHLTNRVHAAAFALEKGIDPEEDQTA